MIVTVGLLAGCGSEGRYDPRGNRWDVLPEMPSARHGMGAAVVDDRIWVPGGANVQGFGGVATNHVFTPPADRSCN